MLLLISFSGLPGVGKSTIARSLARHIRAAYVRVDSVEAALRMSVLKIHPAEDAGYLAAANIAKDNLSLGLNVVADTVNPVLETRALWASVADDTGARLVNVHLICSDLVEHRRRIETRNSDIEGLENPDWEQVTGRHFVEWTQDRLTLDTSTLSVDESTAKIIEYLPTTS